jgi:hypothetical protein
VKTNYHSVEMNDLAARNWSGTKCNCGKVKREKESFCWSCWNLLEDCPSRPKLHGTFGSEYTSAYLACCEYLKAKAVKP